MTFDLALYPAAGPGLGHLMRCYALAEAAVEMKAKVIVVRPAGEAPDAGLSMAWPCPVLVGRPEEAHVSIADGLSPSPSHGDAMAGRWYITDTRPLPAHHQNDAVGYIYPHFGAVPVPGFPTFVGPGWMPLRRAFMVSQMPIRRLGTLMYKAPPEIERAEFGLHGSLCVGLPANGAADAADLMRECYRAVVPPSTIAYEALAMGLSVELLHVAFPGCEQVGQAMVDAGVATWYGDAAVRPPYYDGLGAARLLKALL